MTGQVVDALLDHLGPLTIVLADKAYDADCIRELIQERAATFNLPQRATGVESCFSTRLYRERNLIERIFSKLKHFRRCHALRQARRQTSWLWSDSPQRVCGSAIKSLQLKSTESAKSWSASLAQLVLFITR